MSKMQTIGTIYSEEGEASFALNEDGTVVIMFHSHLYEHDIDNYATRCGVVKGQGTLAHDAVEIIPWKFNTPTKNIDEMSVEDLSAAIFTAMALELPDSAIDKAYGTIVEKYLRYGKSEFEAHEWARRKIRQRASRGSAEMYAQVCARFPVVESEHHGK